MWADFRFHSHPGYRFASLSPLLGILPMSGRRDRWKRPMIGLPEEIIRDVNQAGIVLPRLFAAGRLPEEAGADGITFLGGPMDWDDV